MRKSKDSSQRYSPQAIHTIPHRLAIVEICGNNRVLVENHQGIIGYSDTEIRIRVCFGAISVQGQMLKICRMNREQLVICGRINGVNLWENG